MRLTLVSIAIGTSFLSSFSYASPLQSLSSRIAASSTISGYSYQGCYTEATNMRALTGSAFFDDLMTVEKCATACNAYSWFGVEYGRECYCGNTINQGSISTAETDCNFACPGDSAEKCGAGDRLNMYKKSTGTASTTGSTSSISATTTPTLGSYAAEGCYTEATNGRALTGKRYDDDAMTVEKCAAACVDFTYFGVEYYRECYCGNTLQAGSVTAPATECKYACSGDNTELCGGDYRLNLYTFGTKTTSSTSMTSSTSATPIASNYAFEGCYTEATNSRALTGATFYDDAMTIEKCATVCTGWTLFGLEYGRECYCGNTFQAGSVLTAITDCSFPCPGNNAQFCGAGNRLDMYQFGATVSASSSSTTTSSSQALSSSSSSVSSITSTNVISSTTDAASSSQIPSSSSTQSSTTSNAQSSSSSTVSQSPITTSASVSSSLSTISSISSSPTSFSSTSSTSTFSSTTTTSSVSSSPTSFSSTSSISTTSSSTTTTTSLTTTTTTTTMTTISSTTSATPTPTSVLNNGGFEATNSAAVGWANSGCTGGSCPVINLMLPSNSDITAHGGSQMASILYKANLYAASFEQSFPTTPGTTYAFSIWTWAPNNANGCSWTFYQLATGLSQQAKPGPLLGSAANRGLWVQTTGTFTSQTATSMKFHLQLACNSGGNPRTFYIDDISIAPV